MGASGLFGGAKAPAFPGSSRKPGPQSRLSFAAAGGDRWEDERDGERERESEWRVKELPTLFLIWMIYRRESMHGAAVGRLGVTPGVDPRAVTSRKFMDDSVKMLSEFLATTGYMGEVAPARLLSPTSASFRSIMVHLIKMLDASYVVGPPDKFADELQALFKQLKWVGTSSDSPAHAAPHCVLRRYPFPISKTAITAAGAQQSWPTLLAAITWLVALLKVGWVM